MREGGHVIAVVSFSILSFKTYSLTLTDFHLCNGSQQRQIRWRSVLIWQLGISM